LLPQFGRHSSLFSVHREGADLRRQSQ
jgi:hypothetical protein